MFVNQCKQCGKRFFAKSKETKYCGKICRQDAAEKRRLSLEQPCWSCKNATGGCSWSKCFKPVCGWVAEAVETKDEEGNIRTYRIRSCPQFVVG